MAAIAVLLALLDALPPAAQTAALHIRTAPLPAKAGGRDDAGAKARLSNNAL